MADDIFDQAAKSSGDIFDKAASAPGPNLKTGQGMEAAAQQQAHTVLSGTGLAGKYSPQGQKISGPNGEPLNVIEQQPDTQTNLAIAMNRASQSPTPLTNASSLYAPVPAARAIIGAKLGGKAGSYFGPYGELAGGITGGLIGGMPAPSSLGRKVYTPSGDLSPWADALTHPSKLPEKVLRTVIPEPPSSPGAPLPSAEEFYAAKAADLTRRGAQQAVLDRQAAVIARQTAKNAPQPSPFAGMTSTAGGAPPVAAAPTMPQGTPTPFVNKFTPPEPTRIVGPDSPPPSMKVTYQSYPREALYQMAKQGDIDAGLELVRNPKGFSLPPNFKFLIEESAKKMPWRNLSK